MKQIIEISPRFASLASLMQQIALSGVPPEATLIYKARNCVFDLEYAGFHLIIKAFRIPRFVNSYVYGNLRKSKARRSYEYAVALQKMGIGTPDPVAYIEIRDGLKMKESYYICLRIDGNTVRDWERLPESEALINALGADMHRLHRAGVYHKDFSPGNILYTTTEDGNYHFYYIDLNRMEFGVKSTTKLMRNFRAIHLDMDQTLRLARAYARACGTSEEAVASQAKAQVEAYRREKSLHKFFKKIIGNG